MGERTRADLQYRQSLPINIKVAMTKSRIREWINWYGEEGVYVSFSGGKDSTVLLHIAREMYPDLKAMFVDIPTQYPELRQFVKTFENVDIVYPKINFFQVCEKYGFPIISKEISGKFHEARTNKNGYAAKAFDGAKKNSKFDISGWKWLLDAPFELHSACCDAMKKNPAKRYEKETGRIPITAQMADESKVRMTQWLQHGCNAWDKKRPISNPMSFWTEQDVLKYIRENNISICSVYGDIVSDAEEMGQMNLTDFGIKNAETEEKLHCTGCQRTGCVLCAFGAHLERERERAICTAQKDAPENVPTFGRLQK